MRTHFKITIKDTDNGSIVMLSTTNDIVLYTRTLDTKLDTIVPSEYDDVQKFGDSLISFLLTK